MHSLSVNVSTLQPYVAKFMQWERQKWNQRKILVVSPSLGMASPWHHHDVTRIRWNHMWGQTKIKWHHTWWHHCCVIEYRIASYYVISWDQTTSSLTSILLPAHTGPMCNTFFGLRNHRWGWASGTVRLISPARRGFETDCNDLFIFALASITEIPM